MNEFKNTHNVDNEHALLQCRYADEESKISDKLKAAEQKLFEANVPCTRQVRVNLNDRVVFALQVYADDYSYIAKVRRIIGQDYQLVLNVNHQQLLIR